MSHFWQKASTFVRRSSISLVAVSAAAGSGHFYYATQASSDQRRFVPRRAPRAIVSIAVPRDGVIVPGMQGTGMIIRSDGTILTCAHILKDAQGAPYKGKVHVTLQDGRVFGGSIVNRDVLSDLAIVKINSLMPLPAAILVPTSMLHSGDKVLAAAFTSRLVDRIAFTSKRENKVVFGTVSHVNRRSSYLYVGGFLQNYIQTSCPIVPVFCGGPLVKPTGEIIGVNVSTIPCPIKGVACAIPIDTVIRIMDQFKRNGRVVRPWIGLCMMDLSHTILALLKGKKIGASFPNVDKGVVLPEVTPGSPAELAGFQPGDFVVKFDGKPVESVQEILDIMHNSRVGLPLEVVVKRPNNVTATLTVTPEEAPADFYPRFANCRYGLRCLFFSMILNSLCIRPRLC